MKQLLLLTSLSLFSISSQAQRISSDLIMNHISYLSSDELGGRATSTKEELKAAKYIVEQFKGIQLQPKGTEGYYFDFLYKYNRNIHDTNTSLLETKRGRNVVGFLDNNAAQTVVIGAHYDHLGYGLDHNSLDPSPENKIHNGADDNASGVAGVIELARYFSLNGITEKYNFLFMTFSGEELGLIGSKKWCDNPTIPLSSINYMINLDMIGRLNDTTKKLLVYGVGTSPAWLPAIDKMNTSFSIKTDSAGVGPSDQTSFYLKDIPVLHFFTGQHSDYHKPTDDANKVNIPGEARILEFIVDLVYYLDMRPKLGFLKTRQEESRKMSFKVTMGIMPDYVYEGNGLRLDGVSENKPAAKAGLQQGDVIIRIGDKEIQNIQDYMKELNSFNVGEEVDVMILRKNQRMSMKVRF